MNELIKKLVLYILFVEKHWAKLTVRTVYMPHNYKTLKTKQDFVFGFRFQLYGRSAIVIRSTVIESWSRRKETSNLHARRAKAALRQSENLLPSLKARANNPIYVLWSVAPSWFGWQVSFTVFLALETRKGTPIARSEREREREILGRKEGKRKGETELRIDGERTNERTCRQDVVVHRHIYGWALKFTTTPLTWSEPVPADTILHLALTECRHFEKHPCRF